MSLKTASGSVFQMKLEQVPVNEAMNRDSNGSLFFPSVTAKEQCTRVPRMLSASFRVNLLPLIQELSLSRYLAFLVLGIWMVFATRSYRKPRYMNDELRGLVLECFHGHPRGHTIELIVFMS